MHRSRGWLIDKANLETETGLEIVLIVNIHEPVTLMRVIHHIPDTFPIRSGHVPNSFPIKRRQRWISYH
jgi:hypothetical protein